MRSTHSQLGWHPNVFMNTIFNVTNLHVVRAGGRVTPGMAVKCNIMSRHVTGDDAVGSNVQV